MPIATLTSKGRLTLPQAVRKARGVGAGDNIDFVAEADGGFRMVALRQDAKLLRGRFAGRAAAPVSVKAMADAVLAEGAARRTPPATRKVRGC
jgi:bifunctional DNA-binding transcriptional regulator/antitoxin component of YhaV-PrlF toxin-antitoxin module